jgi:hypothetical protein
VDEDEDEEGGDEDKTVTIQSYTKSMFAVDIAAIKLRFRLVFSCINSGVDMDALRMYN